MTTADQLYDDLLQTPADLTLRLILADALDDEAEDAGKEVPTPFAAYLRAKPDYDQYFFASNVERSMCLDFATILLKRPLADEDSVQREPNDRRVTMGRSYRLVVPCHCGATPTRWAIEVLGGKGLSIRDVEFQTVELAPHPYFLDGVKKLLRVGRCGKCDRAFVMYGAPIEKG